MTKIEVERAGAAETAAIAELVHALLDELSGGKAAAPETMARTAETVLADARIVAFLARAGGAPVGALMLNEAAAIYAGGRFGVITELYVKPAFRSAGVAALLVEAAMAEARSRGWGRVEVGAPAQPQWARTLRFYLRNGFAEIGPRLRRMV
ncbi:MAG: GNAT family N-acetyltransferase [Pikeienuella sp.]